MTPILRGVSAMLVVDKISRVTTVVRRFLIGGI